MSKKKNKKEKQPESAKNIKCWNPEGSEKNIKFLTDRLEQMFVEMGQKKRIRQGNRPARRAVFRKQHGIAYGRFVVEKNIDSCSYKNVSFHEGIFKQGLSKENGFECAVRFSSDIAPTDPDLNSTIGVGLKLFGVEGDKLFGEGQTADFIFQNIDRFFAKDAQEMFDVTTAGAIDHNYNAYLSKHKNRKVKNILQAMQKEEASVLSASYWAILPFQLGENHIVKYRLVPENPRGGVASANPNYLAEKLQQHLREEAAVFRFEVQIRTNEDTMPIDNAQVVWSEKQSPYVCIAKLHLDQQDITYTGQKEFGTNLSYNIWRTLEAHRPLGSIAEVRREVYAASAKVRHEANGQQAAIKEPAHLQKLVNLEDVNIDDDCIVSAGIYPPIGVMRVGNSKKEYFIGPLVDTPIPQEDDMAYRDSTGALKRQAAQFRIYGFNAAGKAVKELTANNAEITWHAHLANQKSSWYQFLIAMDIPEYNQESISHLRNSNIPDRRSLLIDGGKQSITGTMVEECPTFKGKFLEKEVYLGEMRTDDKGRLIMLGGHGKAENVHQDFAVTFANNEGWYDDTSDGPVTANVVYKGVELRVDPAWVICGPPDYAPMQKSVRTMWDMMRSVSIEAKALPRPVRPSFTKDILPIFQRMTDLQWVNAGFAGSFGWGGPFNYTSEEWIAKLNDPSPANKSMRRALSNNFRRYDGMGARAPQLWPWIYGDGVGLTGALHEYGSLSKLQLSFLEQWAMGDFEADYKSDSLTIVGCPFHNQIDKIQTDKVPELDDMPIAEQPDMMTKAAMDFCLADAFHPGCELTWPMRNSRLYMAPFRVRQAPFNELLAGEELPMSSIYFGPTMEPSTLGLDLGPLFGGQVAGGLTRWMAIPWQTDTASCRDGYNKEYDPYLPTFWPARVPNNILNQTRYQEVLDDDLPKETRMEAFQDRMEWLHRLPAIDGLTGYTEEINSMVANFDKLPIVQLHKGVLGDNDFPTEMQVGVSYTDILCKELKNIINEDIIKFQNVLKTDKSKKYTKALKTLNKIRRELENENILLKYQYLNDTLQKVKQLDHLLDKKENSSSTISQLLNTLIGHVELPIIADKTKENLHHKIANPKLEHVGIPLRKTRFEPFNFDS